MGYSSWLGWQGCDPTHVMSHVSLRYKSDSRADRSFFRDKKVSTLNALTCKPQKNTDNTAGGPFVRFMMP